MRSNKLFAVITAVSMIVALTSCSGSDSSSGSKNDSSAASESTSSSAENTSASGENLITAAYSTENETETETNDEVLQEIIDTVEEQEVADKYFDDLGSIGDLVVLDDDDPEKELGDYYESSNGAKLYFDKDKIPAEVMLLFEKYFKSYSEQNYTEYTRCLYPSYIKGMDDFLQKDYGYGLKTSFAKQCKNLMDSVGGEFEITRLKVDLRENSDPAEFMKPTSECFGYDYYETIKGEVDKFYDCDFYVIVREEDGHEMAILSEYEIVFAEKDGKIYTFG